MFGHQEAILFLHRVCSRPAGRGRFMSTPPCLFPQLPFWRRPYAVERLQRDERRRHWLWSRPYFPTQLLRLQGADPGRDIRYQAVVAGLFWLYQSAAGYLEFEELKLVRVCTAGRLVHRATLNASEEAAGVASSPCDNVSEASSGLSDNYLLAAVDGHFEAQNLVTLVPFESVWGEREPEPEPVD